MLSGKKEGKGQRFGGAVAHVELKLCREVLPVCVAVAHAELQISRESAAGLRSSDPC